MSEKRFDSIENKLDRVTDSMQEIKAELSRYNATLEIHVKRTDLAEERIDSVERSVIVHSTAWRIVAVGAAIITGLVGLIATIKVL